MSKSTSDLIKLIKERKNKNGITYFCRIWYPPKENTATITLGKKTKDFGEIEALQLLSKIYEEFEKNNYDYKTLIEDYKDLPKKKLIETKQNEKTLIQIYEEYYNNKLEILEDKIFDKFKDEFKLTKTDTKNNNIYKIREKGLLKLKKSYYKHLIIDNKGNYFKYTKKLFRDIDKNDIKFIIRTIKDKGLGEKTRFNILGQLKTIINFGIDELDLKPIMTNPFELLTDDEKKSIRNPKYTRERIIDENETKLLFKTLYKLPTKTICNNSFIGALLGYCLCARLQTVLQIQKKDLVIEEVENLINVKNNTNRIKRYRYKEVKIYNIKSTNTHKIPLPNYLGEFLYQYLIDTDLDEYIIRPERNLKKYKEEPRPIGKMSEDYYLTCNKLFYFSKEINQAYDELDRFKKELELVTKELRFYTKYKKEDLSEKVLQSRRYEQYKIKLKMQECYRKDIKKLKNEIKQLVKELDSNNKFKREKKFGFHSLRHLCSSYVAKYSLIYSHYMLNHSNNNIKEYETTLGYTKVISKELKQILTEVFDKTIKYVILNTVEYNHYLNQQESQEYIYLTQYAKEFEYESLGDRVKDIFVISHNEFTENRKNKIDKIEQKKQHFKYLKERYIKQKDIRIKRTLYETV